MSAKSSLHLVSCFGSRHISLIAPLTRFNTRLSHLWPQSGGVVWNVGWSPLLRPSSLRLGNILSQVKRAEGHRSTYCAPGGPPSCHITHCSEIWLGFLEEDCHFRSPTEGTFADSLFLPHMWHDADGFLGFRNLCRFCSRSVFHIPASVKVCTATSMPQMPTNVEIKGYGLTECSGGIIHQIDEDESAFGCVGKLFAGVYVADCFRL